MRLHDTLPPTSDTATLPPQQRSWARIPGRLSRYVLPIAGSFVIAVLSLLVLPNSIAYDPWNWLVWGREIAHLALNTRYAASSVKPLPMMFDTVFSVTGPLAPWLWLVTARAASAMALFLAYRLGARLAGPVAGVIALIALLSSLQFASYLMVQGMAEPMGAAFALAAAEAHLDGRRRATLVGLIGVCLIRIEAWPFACGYALWCILRPRIQSWRASRPATDQRRVDGEPQPRRLHLGGWLEGISWRGVIGLAVLALAIPAVWFLPDLWGSGDLLRSAQTATHESQGGPLLSKIPGLATVNEARQLLPLPFTAAFVWRWGADMVALIRRRRTPTWWLGSCAMCWLVIEAVMAQLGVATGAPRYLLPGATCLAAVVAGFAWAQVFRWVIARWGRFRLTVPALSVVCAVIVLGLAFHEGVGQIPKRLRAGERSGQAGREIGAFVRRTGGRAAVLSCGGTVATGPYQVPMLAWKLNVPVGSISDRVGPRGTVFALNHRPRVPARYRHDYHVVATTAATGARWVKLTTCPASSR